MNRDEFRGHATTRIHGKTTSRNTCKIGAKCAIFNKSQGVVGKEQKLSENAHLISDL